MPNLTLLALTPAGLLDPSIAIAASRAGAVGVLNLEFARDPVAACQALASLLSHARGNVGMRLSSADDAIIAAVLPALSEQVGDVLLTAHSHASVRALVPQLGARGRRVWLEVTSEREAALAVETGAHGLVAKGNESGGWVGESTTYVLLQALRASYTLPVLAFGGIGVHTVAACAAAGAAGVVLDSQLALVRESALPDEVKAAVASMDGSETIALGAEFGAAIRLYHRPFLPALRTLQQRAAGLGDDAAVARAATDAWHATVSPLVGWGSPAHCVWPVGQDAAFAASLAERHVTVAGVLAAVGASVDAHLERASKARALAEGAPLAASHRTRYPIVQGAMTRVSDRAEFALRVAESGALPFLALALMRGDEAEPLLADTQRLLGERSWGVGILGFAPPQLREEQLALVRRFRPPFALIAGGRPEQARALERDGIITYLHVPSPGLLKLFLQDGARHFVFEGRECGGHVGPRSSFVLWNTMIDVLLESLPAADASRCHVLFAGGIHDARSAAMVAAAAAPLVERGVKVGVLVGTAYLFTQDAVASGAIVQGFQQRALACDSTTLVESGPGHAIRCVPNAYTDEYFAEQRRLVAEGHSAEQIREKLEELGLGRLRVASKGLKRHPGHGIEPGAPKLVDVSAQEQQRDGMYMIGQIAALRDRVVTMADLHHDISAGSTAQLEALASRMHAVNEGIEPRPLSIAIVGMSCILPKAPDIRTFWENVTGKVYAITDVPADRWDTGPYFDADPRAKDKIYAKAGGFIDDVPFDPLEFGMPPASIKSIDPVQLLALKAARDALADAGYLKRPFERARTSVILGASGGAGELGTQYCLRAMLPSLFGSAAADLVTRAGDALPEWTEDSFAGTLLNVVAGRIANRFDFGGVNYVVDAACGSSLAALHSAVRELDARSSDMVLVGGIDNTQSPFGYVSFSKTSALSPKGTPRTFDADADGIVISEGVVMMVLKRLEDAERDGDRVYAVIRASAGSSDGRAKGLTAPRAEGQALALERAYAQAGVSPASVELFEAHGTGTVVGDRTEAAALASFLDSAGAPQASAALGSVKSMIGHTKATAGMAGLAKAALALHERVLPPTLGVTTPNPAARFGEGPLYVNSETRPWLHADDASPRRAGVSAFGFGGTNFHTVVEEYTGDYLPRASVSPAWPSELFLWNAESRAALDAALASLETSLAGGAAPELCELSWALADAAAARDSRNDGARLAIVASSLDDLSQKLAAARVLVARGGNVDDPRGIYCVDGESALRGRIALLFPGQGSQYPNMLRDLVLRWPDSRETFEAFDRTLSDRYPHALSRHVFPPPAFTKDEERVQQAALTATNVAQPALGAADLAIFHVLRDAGVRGDVMAGHSYGEYVALCAAGAFDERTLAVLSEARGRSIIEAATNDLGTMAAATATAEQVAAALHGADDVWLANLNAPRQTIISGTRGGVSTAIERLEKAGITARPIPVACAFHSPLVAPAQARLAEYLRAAAFSPPLVDVYSNTSAAPYPHDAEAIAAQLADHLVKPVRFHEQIEAMYAAGVRVFVEAGPRNVLTGLVKSVLGDRPHLAVATDVPGRSAITSLQHALGQLAVHGVPVRLEALLRGRAVRRLPLQALLDGSKRAPYSATTWLVNGGRAWPARERKVLERRAPLSSILSAAPQSGAPMTSPPAQPTAAHESNAAASNGHPAVPASATASVAAPVAASVNDDDVTKVMLQFQQVMSRSLEVQRNVMLAYLQGAPVPVATGAAVPVTQSTVSTTSDRVTADQATVSAVAAPVSVSQPDAGAAAPSVDAPHPHASSSSGMASAVTARVSVQERPDEAGISRVLLQIVSERTGYPPEMLALDVDMEADLGIDSIKRVEIVGTLLRTLLPDAENASGRHSSEQLTSVRTLRALIAAVTQASQPAAEKVADAPLVPPSRAAALAEARTAPAARHVSPSPAAGEDAPRSVFVAVETPSSGAPLTVAQGHVLLVTDDGHGIAASVANALRRAGQRAILVQDGTASPVLTGDIAAADIGDANVAEALVSLVKERFGPIGGVMHLRPLADIGADPVMALSDWRARVKRDVKSLFNLARAAGADMRRAGGAGGSLLFAAGALGGTWGARAERDTELHRLARPWQGGLGGFVKSVAQEWPSVHCRAIDLDPRDSAANLASSLLSELVSSDDVEVGYRDGKRFALRQRRAPLSPVNARNAAVLTPESVVLVTGGARGITAEVALRIAQRWRSTLVLAGRSAPPPAEESAATAGLTTPRELKAALLDAARARGETPTLPQLEAAYHRLLHDREMRATLRRIRETGARVQYAQVDVRDETAMTALIAHIEREHGRLDGVVHGAGIIDDKLVEHKTPASFDRVFDTKADSAFLLSQLLRPASLRFFILFSSASGAFGNRGQADYAAANEVLSKMAIGLDAAWPGRVVAMDWGPWATAGMVSPELERQFAEQGVTLIPMSAGCDAFERELECEDKGVGEVIIAGGKWGAGVADVSAGA